MIQLTSKELFHSMHFSEDLNLGLELSELFLPSNQRITPFMSFEFS